MLNVRTTTGDITMYPNANKDSAVLTLITYRRRCIVQLRFKSLTLLIHFLRISRKCDASCQILGAPLHWS